MRFQKMAADTEPYVGPRFFRREDQSIFFGRSREANELLSLVISHSVVLLYAQSGAGKTSLINAKLEPLLEDEEFEVLPIARMRTAFPVGRSCRSPTSMYFTHWSVGPATASRHRCSQA